MAGPYIVFTVMYLNTSVHSSSCIFSLLLKYIYILIVYCGGLIDLDAEISCKLTKVLKCQDAHSWPESSTLSITTLFFNKDYSVF